MLNVKETYKRNIFTSWNLYYSNRVKEGEQRMKIFHRHKKENSKEKNLKIENLNSEIIVPNEAYKTLRTNIQFCQANTEIKTLVVTSSCPNEGKSTTVFNLGNTFAESGRKVLIIDCDLRKPILHKFYNIPSDKG